MWKMELYVYGTLQILIDNLTSNKRTRRDVIAKYCSKFYERRL